MIVMPAVWLGAYTDAEHGNVADWVAAGATVTAVLVAISAGRWAKKAYDLEFKRSGDAKDRADAEQASAVAGWFAHFETDDGTDIGASGVLEQGITPARAVVHLRNHSPLPVHDVRIKVTIVVIDSEDNKRDIRRSYDLAPITLLAPSEGSTEPVSVAMKSTGQRLRQGMDAFETYLTMVAAQNARIQAIVASAVGTGRAADVLHVEVSIRFMDSSRQRWIRHTSGRLTKDGTLNSQ